MEHFIYYISIKCVSTGRIKRIYIFVAEPFFMSLNHHCNLCHLSHIAFVKVVEVAAALSLVYLSPFVLFKTDLVIYLLPRIFCCFFLCALTE